MPGSARHPHKAVPRLYDVVVVGGGPAGLSAALVLGRARRSVLVCDDGRPRNLAARSVHGLLTRDGLAPLRLRRIARDEIARYGVELRAGTVRGIRRQGDGFAVRLDGGQVFGRRVLLATGVRDLLPPLENLARFYGRTVHHCPHCDGWEHRDRALAVYGRGRSGAALALTLLGWSADVVLLTDGPSRLGPIDRERLARCGIPVERRRIASLAGPGARLRRIVFRDGPPLPRDAVFLGMPHQQSCDLAAGLGCRMSSKGHVLTDRLQHTGVRGLYSAGDATHDVHFVVVAMAEGAKAAVAIDHELRDEDRQRTAARATVRRR